MASLVDKRSRMRHFVAQLTNAIRNTFSWFGGRRRNLGKEGHDDGKGVLLESLCSRKRWWSRMPKTVVYT